MRSVEPEKGYKNRAFWRDLISSVGGNAEAGRSPRNQLGVAESIQAEHATRHHKDGEREDRLDQPLAALDCRPGAEFAADSEAYD